MILNANAVTPHEGFVYLRDIEPTIIENLRYYSDENFTGRVLPGYKSGKVMLTKQTALALQKVQQELLKEGYSLVIYDAYRPQKTVNYFEKWAIDLNDQLKKREYYPRIDKKDAFKIGYIASRSAHTRGSTVDLSIIALGKKLLNPLKQEERELLDGSRVTYLDDGTIDMGTSFDLFDIASSHKNDIVPSKHLANREYLRQKMLKYGFDDYSKEWWHYKLKDEPFPNDYFDFDVR
jgi:D-alanyl-D-alanine dipeptidase